MIIHAQNNAIIFECDYCKIHQKIDTGKTKRQFQTLLNRFYRDHDWNCKFNIERQQKILQSVQTSEEILKKLSNKFKCLE